MIINNELSAETFLNEVKKANLTGREFLALIGNSKLDNNAFIEIRDGKGLTKERLYQIFEESALTSADYYRMLSAAFELKRRKDEKKRAENEEKLRAQIEDANRKRSQAKLAELKALADRENDYSKESVNNDEITAGSSIKGQFEAKQPNVTDSGDASESLPREPFREPTREPYRIEKKLRFGMVSDDDYDDEESIDNEFGFGGTDRRRGDNVLSKHDFDDDMDSDSNDFNDFDDFNDEDDDEKTNKGKIIVSLLLAFCLVVSSFVVRYRETGSFLLQDTGVIEFKPLETYLELARGIFDLPDIKFNAPKLEGDYYIKTGKTDAEAGKSSVNTPSYTFYVYGDTLYGLDLNSGESEFAFEITKNGMKLNSFYINGEKLYVIYDYAYDKSYNSNYQLNFGGVESVDDEPAGNPISGKYEQKATAVDVYSAVSYNPSPLTSYTLDGEFVKIGDLGGNVYIATEYVPFEPAYSDVPNAFVPSYSLNGQENLVPIEKITLSHKPESRRMTVIGFVENNLTAAAVGGESAGLASFEDSLYVILGKGESSEMLRYDDLLNAVSFIAKGTVYDSSVDEANGIVRFCSEDESETRLYTLDVNLNPLSVVEKIAGGEKIKNVLFDDKTAYIIGDKVYVIDTSIPDEPYISERISASIYSDNYLRWSDSERISLEYITADNGSKTGIRLTVFKLEKEVYSEMAAISVPIETTIEGNWDEFLKSPVETEDYELFLMPQKGIIILPFSYFNGISEISKFVILEYGEHTGIVKVYEYTEYDSRAVKLAAAVSDSEQVYLFMDDRIKTFSLSAINNTSLIQ